MPQYTVGNIRVSVTFSSRLTYDKQGRMINEKTMTTSYFNAQTRKAATKAEIAAAGIKNIQKRNVKLTQENASYLMQRAQAASKGELKTKNFVNLLGSRSYGLSTAQQKLQFKDALLNMFESSNPTDKELAAWKEMVDNMSVDEMQDFYQRYKKELKPGFEGYHSAWNSSGSEEMAVLNGTYDGRPMDEIAARNANAKDRRKKILRAGRSYMRDKGRLDRLQITLDIY